ncbi:hypothetical protein LMG28727_05639 [Paraburkholderia kirstenboschensis]|nr:hypothetical protein LMG28727_05639 [Paraburkholderia kirstenboschensis]
MDFRCARALSQSGFPGRALSGFARAHEADDVLLRLGGVTLRGLLLGLLLGVLFGEVPANHAAADRADDRMVSRVMPSDAAHYRTLEAARGVCRACRREDQRGCNEGDSYRASFHSKILTGWMFWIGRLRAPFPPFPSFPSFPPFQ